MLKLVIVLSLVATQSAVAQTITPKLERWLRSASAGDNQLVWVYLTDKGDVSGRLNDARRKLSSRALERRAKRGSGADVRYDDIPPLPAYVQAIRERAPRVRHVSSWFNAVSVEASSDQIAELARLPFVTRLDAVGRFTKGAEEPMVSMRRGTPLSTDSYARPPDYGSSFGQLEQINVPALHDLGLSGAGVVIAVFDTGFRNLRHEALGHLSILTRWDFVNGDSTVGNNRDRGDGSHGGIVLSVIGGYAPGELIGPAYGATFILAKTENTESETPIEEDNWVAATEWAEAWGADVISTSLGYLDFDAPFGGYTPDDLDGETAVTTRAAQMAAERGVVVVASAGNGGFQPNINTLGAPADAKLVLSIGAVDSFGVRADFSSVGRTADGRIKPDVMAQGVLVKGIDPAATDQYVLADGTSFACPLTAGVVALLLEAHPEWTVQRVRAALRSTASNASTPTRLMGWGIVDGLAALASR